MKVIASLVASILLLIVARTPTVAAQNLCNLCADGDPVAWPMAVLKNDGTTCSKMAADIAGYDPWSDKCQELVYFWRKSCCEATSRPKDVPITPTPAPVISGVESGPNPICNLCRDGDFPGNTAMVINMLYIGAGDCEQFYNYGLQGQIPAHLCDPLQYFAYEPCGCGEFNNPSNQSPPAPAPSNGGGSPSGVIQTRKQPDGDGKEGVKLSNQRGGAGGRYVGVRRGLKGNQDRRKLRYVK